MKKFYTSLAAVLLAVLSYAQTTNNITSKYDFIPGEQIIFYDDFSSEAIGDFPMQWLTNASGEIVTTSQFPGWWFQMTKSGYYIPQITDPFTDNFTIEYDMVILSDLGSETVGGIDFFITSDNINSPAYGSQPGQAGLKIQPDYETVFWNNWSEAREWQGDEGKAGFKFQIAQQYHIAFWIQKQRVRMYADEQKVLDLPRGLQAGYEYNIFRIEDFSDEYTTLISNFRVAAGLPDLRSRLITDGKLVSYGIYFDVNSEKLKPESNATIKEIALVLTDNPNVNISITGHTDADGDEASNLDLSKRRAASVKNELVSKYAINASRITTDGKGESQPLAPNDTALNKSKNRRVEFIKL